MMKFQGVPLLVGLILFFTLLCLYLLYDPVYCIVKGAGVEKLNGYFSASDGRYSKIGSESISRLIPDVFGVFNFRKVPTSVSEAILFVNGNWLMINSGKIVYHTDPAATDVNIHNPPNQYWMLSNSKDEPIPSNVQCSGWLEDSPRLQGNDNSNMGSLVSRPVTTVLLLILCYYAYYLWKNNIEVAAVSYSYEAIMHRGEYWRIVTASFAHFDLIHLGFNCMGLYQLGLLEPIYGSIVFAYLNIALVFFTMAICLLTHYILINRYNSTQYLSQQAVGYSCVLFAWMVALSVRLVKFCPIFMFPNFCMNTMFLPLPFKLGRLAFNFGPFLLLIFTQMILSRASFIGHLSGILIGYPLAWGALNFASPIRLLLILTIAYLAVENLKVTKYYDLYKLQVQNQGSLPPVSEVIERGQSYVNYFRWKYSSILVALLMLGEAYFKVSLWDWTSLFICFTFIYLACTSILCRTIMYYTSYGYVGIECGKLMIVSFVFLIAVLIYQYFNLLALWSTHRLLTTSGLSYTWLEAYSVILSVLMLVEIVNIFYLYQMTKEIITAQQQLQSYHWDSASLNEDWLKLKQRVCFCRRGGNSDLELQNLEVFQQSSGNRLGNQTVTAPPSSAPARSNADQLRRERALARFEASNKTSNSATVYQAVNNPINQYQSSTNTNNTSSLGLGILSSLTQPGNATTVNGVRYERIPADDITLEEGNSPDPRNVVRRNSPSSNDRRGNTSSKTLEI